MAYARIVIIILLFKSTCIQNIAQPFSKITDVFEKTFVKHANKSNIIKICKSRLIICKSNDLSVCTLRIRNDVSEYKNFENSCYLFLSNLCDQPDEEYYILESGHCPNVETRKFSLRRYEYTNASVDTNATSLNSTENSTSDNSSEDTASVNSTTEYGNGSIAKPIGRSSKTTKITTMAPLYEIDLTFDDHICPYTCPNTYSPVCLLANKGEGKYFKYFTFVNQCFAYKYYCKNFRELGPPPDQEYEDVVASPLSWSFCGAYRYIQFARFAEMASSMGHYKWLAGSYPYSHIMEPHQRIEGYG